MFIFVSLVNFAKEQIIFLCGNRLSKTYILSNSLSGAFKVKKQPIAKFYEVELHRFRQHQVDEFYGVRISFSIELLGFHETATIENLLLIE